MTTLIQDKNVEKSLGSVVTDKARDGNIRGATVKGSPFDVVDHVQYSIDLLKKHEPPEGYHLAFSGGKDSQACYKLCEEAGVNFDAHFMRAMEPPELIYFIRKEYPDVIRHLPKQTLFQMIREQGIPPLRNIRYCCRILKEGAGKDRTVVVGVRAEESRARALKQEMGISYHG